MKFDQIIVQLMTNICNMIFAVLWRLETNSRSVYDFDKIAI